MSHYFENDESIKNEPSMVHFLLKGKEFALHSNAGVFSKDKLDTGTKILMETVLENTKETPKTLLDLGCGIGVVGCTLRSFWDCEVTMIDINQRATELARKNMDKYGYPATILCQDGIQSGKFDKILLNPPIRTGKKVIYSLFDQCVEHMSENGETWIVMRKQHGAQSAINYFEEKGCKVKRVNRDKGFWIFVVTK
ncbi:MAG: class I SAM-dependent methyltransferase [Firmicutes bacterium]|nr:class I SAM-dependent methyltransferase [Bacillota bacterium]